MQFHSHPPFRRVTVRPGTAQLLFCLWLCITQCRWCQTNKWFDLVLVCRPASDAEGIPHILCRTPFGRPPSDVVPSPPPPPQQTQPKLMTPPSKSDTLSSRCSHVFNGSCLRDPFRLCRGIMSHNCRRQALCTVTCYDTACAIMQHNIPETSTLESRLTMHITLQFLRTETTISHLGGSKLYVLYCHNCLREFVVVSMTWQISHATSAGVGHH